MKIRQEYRGTSTHIFLVDEFSEREWTLPDRRLIDLVDARGRWDKIDVVHNFGGTVVRLPDRKARVSVYVD